MHIDQSGVGGVPISPHLLQQDLAGEHLARLAGQRHQQVELQRGQRDRVAVAGHLVAGYVDGHVADGQHLGRLRIGPAQPGAQPGDQFLRLERLDDVVVRTGFQSQHHVDRVALRGQHHDRHDGLGSDGLADVDAVHPRQHQVQQHQIGFELPQGRQRFGAVANDGGLEPLTSEHDGQHFGQGRIIVHHEHACLHSQHGCTCHSAAVHPPADRRRRSRHSGGFGAVNTAEWSRPAGSFMQCPYLTAGVHRLTLRSNGNRT